MDYIIRSYTPSDQKDLLALARELRAYLISLNPRRKKEITKHFYENFVQIINTDIQKNFGCVFLAESKGHVVGYIYGTVKNQSQEEKEEFIPTTTGEIIDLFVKHEYRKKGIGRKLMDAGMVYFKEQNCDRASIIVLHNNTESVKYYSRLKFQIEAVEMIKSL